MNRQFSFSAILKVSAWVFTALILSLALQIFSGSAQADDTYISGTVQAAEGGSLNGLVLIEKGRLYNKKFKYGGLVKNGRFSVKVEGGGTHGLHLYATGYVYFPLGIPIVEGKDNTGKYKLPPNPATARAPVVKNIMFVPEKRGTRVTIEVTDPDHDLSHQVLALNVSTGEGFRMDPPGFVLPFARKYPEGIYSLLYEGSGEIDPQNWYFVAADNKCYNSPVLASPFTSEGYMPGKTTDSPAADSTTGRKAGVTSSVTSVSGLEVFRNNCSMCHLADSAKSKVGPGLKGLYMLDKTPVLGKPLTDDVIRKQILEGGKDMPPYSHLIGEEVSAVMEYMKML